MQNNIIFGIPSYNRSERQITLDYLESMGIPKENIYISTQTEEDYKIYLEKYGNRANIIYGKGDCISDNRNNLLNYFNKGTRLLMLDDDLKFVGFKNNKKIEKASSDKFLKFINDAFDYSERNHALIWGGYPVSNGLFMSQSIDKKNVVVGCMMGIIIDEYRFDKNFKLKEDLDFCLQTIKDGYNCIRFNFVNANCKFKVKGGCFENWQNNEDDIMTKRILLKYPKLIKKGNKKNSIMMKGNKK